jgi:CubicO group peptidase (beta-lactamase class C family)
MLHMASGLKWDESYGSIESNIVKMVFEPNALDFARTTEALHEPGTVFNYSSGDTMLMSGVIEQATGMNAYEYGKEKLFDRIGMDMVDWWEDAGGHTLTFCCLDTPTRQFAQFGQLFLQNGEWEGEQVVPAEWVARSTAPWEVAPWYAMQWWIAGLEPEYPNDMYRGTGYDGQYLYVVPSLDMVIARNGSYSKMPGEAVAPEGIVHKLPPAVIRAAGATEYGTLSPDFWIEKEFLVPIFDSIQ